mmetsp:Transcript_6787/g.28902  ORF Transcript_6787/g.28902 Transcript_6787/m.28902 type:complete len:321 (+) Transcript_6787:166-1128(+)
MKPIIGHSSSGRYRAWISSPRLALGTAFLWFLARRAFPRVCACSVSAAASNVLASTRRHRSSSASSSKCRMSSNTSSAVTAPSPSTSNDRTIASASCSADSDSVNAVSAAATSAVWSLPSPSVSIASKLAASSSSLQRRRARCFTTRILNGMPSLPQMADDSGFSSASATHRSSPPHASSASAVEILRPMSRNAGMSSAPSSKPAHVTTRYVRASSSAAPRTVRSSKSNGSESPSSEVSSSEVSSFAPLAVLLRRLATETPSSHCRYPPQLPPSRDLRICSASENATARASSAPVISSVMMLFSKGTSATRSPYVKGSAP